MIILIILLYALFAATFSLGKVLLGFSPPIFLVGVRMFIAGSLLLLYQWTTGRLRFPFSKTHLWYYAQIIIFTTYLPYILRFFGLREMASSKACLLYNLSPFVSYILAYLLFSEKITTKKITGLVIGFIGFLPLLCFSKGALVGLSCISWPELYIMLSVISMSYGWLIVHHLVKQYRYEATMINGISMTFGGLLALITSAALEGILTTTTPVVSDVYSFATILSIVVIVSNLLCHNLYVNLLKYYSPTFLSFAAFLSPLFAALYGWLFLHETVSWNFFITVALVLAGLSLFYHDEVKESDKEELTVATEISEL